VIALDAIRVTHAPWTQADTATNAALVLNSPNAFNIELHRIGQGASCAAAQKGW
jgi:hypothetical protein